MSLSEAEISILAEKLLNDPKFHGKLFAVCSKNLKTGSFKSDLDLFLSDYKNLRREEILSEMDRWMNSFLRPRMEREKEKIQEVVDSFILNKLESMTEKIVESVVSTAVKNNVRRVRSCIHDAMNKYIGTLDLKFDLTGALTDYQESPYDHDY